MTEVLQGMTRDRDFRDARNLLTALDIVVLGREAIAIEAAQNSRRLREMGITVHKTIDCIIATRCIIDGISSLHSDRDFEPFVEHLGLRSVF